MRTARAFEIIHHVGIPRHFDDHCATGMSDASDFGSSTVWKNAVKKDRIHVRGPQDRERLSHGVRRTHTIL